MTLGEAITLLKSSGVDSPLHDARAIFAHFGSFPHYLLTDKGLSSEDDALINAITRRAAREPLQYILGYADFYRERYEVSPDCLIPRSDTECLVEYAAANIPKGECFLDLCCGSGCIGISTLLATEETRCHSIDISEGALLLTERNSIRNRVSHRLTSSRRNLLCDPLPEGEFFAVLANPPYVTESAYGRLDEEIYFEPRLALVGGGADGGDFYRILTPKCLEKIKDGGFIAYEIGFDQANLLKEIATEHSLDIKIIKDYGGNDRVAVLTKG